MEREIGELGARPPVSAEDWELYYELRWRVLRAPWAQPRGSEKDDREHDSIHAALWAGSGAPVACGRVQLNSPTEAQVRFMAVDPAWKRRGLGSRILAELEMQAVAMGAQTVVLNSRQEAQEFYRRHGYELAGEAHTLFGAVPHVRLRKVLAATR